MCIYTYRLHIAHQFYCLKITIYAQDGISRQQKEEYGRVVEERDHLQEQLQSMGWKSEVVEERKDGEEGEEEREAGKQGEREEEEEEDRGEDRESKITASVASDKSEVSDLLQQIHLVEEGNLKASSGVKETKRTSKVCENSTIWCVCVCVCVCVCGMKPPNM